MRPLACRSHIAVAALALLLASAATRAEDTAIYQQRNADGSVLLTDRPSAGAVTQRTWRVEPQDPGAAQRREAARVDAAEVSRRIGQRLEADERRAQELTLARVRAADLQAQRDADAGAWDGQSAWVVGPRVGAYGRYRDSRGDPRGDPRWNPVAPATPVPSTGAFNPRPPTATIVRGVRLSADGFPIR